MNARAGKRVLIIPHQPLRNVKVRAVEMAAYLAAASDLEVYLLTWELSPPGHSPLPLKILAKASEAWRTGRTRAGIEEKGGIRQVRLPYLLAPYPYCRDFNRCRLERFVRREGIQAVLSANAYHFPLPENDGLLRIYDVVDDHVSPDSGPHWRRTREFTLRELAKADARLTISHGLQNTLAGMGFPDVRLVPNGVDTASFRACPPEAIQAVKSRYGLHDRFVIGYIGNHGWWAGMDLLLDAFSSLERSPGAKLLIVGPGEDLAQARARMADHPDVIFTGPVPPADVAAYFHACNLGVLPFQLNPFTDNALPLKVLEYGASRKPMLATPLAELKILGFPHVQLIEPDVASWRFALTRAIQHPVSWQPAWDDVIARYDWREVLGPVRELLAHALAV